MGQRQTEGLRPVRFREDQWTTAQPSLPVTVAHLPPRSQMGAALILAVQKPRCVANVPRGSDHIAPLDPVAEVSWESAQPRNMVLQGRETITLVGEKEV